MSVLHATDGGPAFPLPVIADPKTGAATCVHDWGTYMENCAGMSLRDYFAGKAMQAVVTGMNMRGKELGDDNTQFVTDCCYEIADSMLRSRKEGGAS